MGRTPAPLHSEVKMKFNISERLMILSLCPKDEETDFISQKIFTDFKNEIRFSQKELDKANIKNTEEGSVIWESDKDFDKEIKVVKRVAEIIIERLKKLHELKKVKEAYLPLYEKFKVDIEMTDDAFEEYTG